MNRLWVLLTADIGTSFRSQFGQPEGDVFNYWSAELIEFSEQQLIQGFNKFKKSGSTYMSLSIFRNHCQPSPEDFGLDDIHAALNKVLDRAWEKLHPAFHHVATQEKYDIYAMKRADRKQTLDMFKPLYREVIRRVAAGENFDRIVMISNERPKIRAATGKELETGQKALSIVFEQLGVRKSA